MRRPKFDLSSCKKEVGWLLVVVGLGWVELTNTIVCVQCCWLLIGLGGVDGRVDMYMQSRLTQLDSAAFLARLVRASRQDPNQ